MVKKDGLPANEPGTPKWTVSGWVIRMDVQTLVHQKL